MKKLHEILLEQIILAHQLKQILFSDGHVFNNAGNLLLTSLFVTFIRIYSTYIPRMFYISIQNTYVKDTFSNKYKSILNCN